MFDRIVRRYYRYRDEMLELIRTPELMIHDLVDRGYLEGDCDDIATFSASVSVYLGLPTRLVSIRTDSIDFDYKHVFAESKIDGTWLRLDATVSNALVMTSYGERMIQHV